VILLFWNGSGGAVAEAVRIDVDAVNGHNRYDADKRNNIEPGLRVGSKAKKNKE